ncbi:hypothetical protein H4R19_001697 [Coemansia spiralis]|nr:hypothetical protein H4R19_001697 [Coemansia spiralis]
MIETTPVRAKIGAARDVQNGTTDDKVRAAQRKEDAKLIRVEDSFENVAEVLTLTRPHNSRAKTAAKHAAARIAAEMEKDLKARTGASDTVLKKLFGKSLRARLSCADKSASDNGLALLARQWTHNFRSIMEHSNGTKLEANMYPLVTTFILYVQRQIKHLHMPAAAHQPVTWARQAQHRPLDVSRLLLPSEGNDFKPKGFDELERIDFALQLCDVDAVVKAQTETHMRDIFAVVECKTKPDHKDDALDQLIQYTRNLYQVQYNRRFAWGLSVCGVDIRAVVMLHDAVLVSPMMRVSTLTGRRRLVELLVNWAVCDDVRAGYDPTVVFDPATRHYRIQCPDNGGDTVWYRTTEFILPADNVIGRHTRCFVAERENEDGKEGRPNDVVIIKDAFAAAAPLSAGDDGRNEIQLLCKIRETFVGDESVDFLYPELVRGSDVKLRVGASEMDDNTDAIFSLMGATRQDKPEPSNSGDQPKRKWLEQPYCVYRQVPEHGQD